VRGIFQYRRLVIRGFSVWLMHRGYHVLAVPTWEHKAWVLAVWATAPLFGRDLVSLASVQQPPREAFVSPGNPRRSDQTADVPAQ
jgi:NADH dehydrogenase